MRKKVQFKKMIRSKGLVAPLIIIKGDPCSKCGIDAWGNIMFCTCPLTPEESKSVAPKYSY